MRNLREHGVLCYEDETEVLRVDHPSQRAMAEQIKQIKENIQSWTSADLWEECQRRIVEGTFETMSYHDQVVYRMLNR
jgi:hypothetical protein